MPREIGLSPGGKKNTREMKVFVYEYLSGGGPLESAPGSKPRQARPVPLDEGIAMLKAALADFNRAPSVEAYTIADHRFKNRFADCPGADLVAGSYRKNFDNALEKCDAVLIVAPETGGALAELTGAALDRGKINCGCGVDAIRATGDKLAFASVMKDAGIPHPATCSVAAVFEPAGFFNKAWVSKPVDGAGSDDVVVHSNDAAVRFPAGARLIAQEYVEGDPMSLCVVSGEKDTVILSVNRQTFNSEKKLQYRGGSVTGDEPDDYLKAIVARIKSKLPGLRGFWGLDYIKTVGGPVVIEVNPRLTTSYCALGKAVGANPAEAILASVRGETLPDSFNRRDVAFTATGELTY